MPGHMNNYRMTFIDQIHKELEFQDLIVAVKPKYQSTSL